LSKSKTLAINVKEKILIRSRSQLVDSMSFKTQICLMKTEIFLNILQLEPKKKNRLPIKDALLKQSNKDNKDKA
jgi:hypothetical protein